MLYIFQTPKKAWQVYTYITKDNTHTYKYKYLQVQVLISYSLIPLSWDDAYRLSLLILFLNKQPFLSRSITDIGTHSVEYCAAYFIFWLQW